MTKTEERIIEFIYSWSAKFGYPPTMREIGKGVGFSSSATVYYHIQRLVAKGLVTYVRGSPRTIRVLTQTRQLVDP